MLKSILAGTVALALAGASVAYAQQRPEARPGQPNAPATQASPAPQSASPQGGPAQSGSVQSGSAQSAAAQAQNEAQAVAEGRLAQLRALLSLTPDQDKNWQPFEQAYRDFVRVRSQRWRDVGAQRRGDNPVEDFQVWTDFVSRRVNGIKRLADAAVPLYQSLDQNQQRRFLDQVYAWHPHLARMSERFSARARSDEDGGRRDSWAGREGRFGNGMGPRWGWRDRDDEHDRGGYGGGFGYGPRPGWRGGDWGGREGCGRGCGQGMCPRWGWRGDDNGWRRGDSGYERGPHYGMGAPGGWGSGGADRDDHRGGFERGPHYGMSPPGGFGRGDGDWGDSRGYDHGSHHGMGHWGDRDRDELDGSRGGWGRGDADEDDNRASNPNEQRF